MDIKEAIQTGYVSALNGLGYPIYTAYAVPEILDYPFILISNISLSQRQIDAPCKVFEVFGIIEVITGYKNPIGNLESLRIGEDIQDIVNPDNGISIDLPVGWRIGDTSLQNSTTLESKSNNYYIYRNVMTFRHLTTKQ